MTAARHWFGDGCPAPHGRPDAPMRWADPGETLEQVRARYLSPGLAASAGHETTPAVGGGKANAGVVRVFQVVAEWIIAVDTPELADRIVVAVNSPVVPRA